MGQSFSPPHLFSTFFTFFFWCHYCQWKCYSPRCYIKLCLLYTITIEANGLKSLYKTSFCFAHIGLANFNGSHRESVESAPLLLLLHTSCVSFTNLLV